MHVISILSQKGGAGKTTLAVNLAVHAYLKNLSVAVIDIDPQASAANWADLRDEQEPITIAIPATRLKQAIETSQDNGADLVIIDSAPFSESATITAARVANFVLVPCRASILDLSAISTTLDLCTAVKADVGIVLNGVKSKSLGIEAQKALQQFETVLAPITIWDRVDYVRSLSSGQGVSEYNSQGKAAQEIRQLYKWLREQV